MATYVKKEPLQSLETVSVEKIIIAKRVLNTNVR